MSDCYKNFLIYTGEKFSVYFHAESNVFSDVNDYFENCEEGTQASLLHLVKRISDTGIIFDETKFRIEDKVHKIYCFKPKQERFFCFFFIGKKIIITSAYTKKKQKLDRKALEKAIRIKKQYQGE